MFLDQASLEVSAGLKDSLQGKLADTEWLVLLLSEESAGSRWVSEEITHWLEDKPKERIALVQTSGEIAWDDEADDFDMARSTAVPDGLAGVYSGQGSEPLWLDLRWAADPGDEGLDLRNTRFRDAIATLAAPIHGKPKDELEGEDIRQHRRLVRLRRAAIAGLTLLTIAATIAGILALINAARARAEARTANARLLASQSRESFRPDQAVLVALEAVRVEPNVEARGSLLDAVRRGAHARYYLHGGVAPAQAADVHPRLGLVATGGFGGQLAIWDVSGPGVPAAATLQAEEGTAGLVAIGELVFHSTASVLYTAGTDGDVKTWDLADPQRPRLVSAVPNPLAPGGALLAGAEFVAAAAVSRDGRLLVSGSEVDTSFGLWDVSVATQPQFVGTYQLAGSDTPSAFAFSDDGSLLAVGTGAGFELWDVGTPEAAAHVGGVAAGEGESQTTALAFVPGLQAVAWGGAGGGMRVWDVSNPGEPVEVVPESGDGLTSLSFALDADVVLVGTTDGQVVTWEIDESGGAVPTAFLAGHGGEVLTARLLADGETIVSVEQAGTVVVWDAAGLDGPGALGRTLEGAPAEVAFDPGGGGFWTVSDRGRLESWALGGGGPSRRVAEGGDGPEGAYTVAGVAGLAAVVADVPFSLGGAAGTLVVWDGDAGEPRWADDLGRAAGTAVAFSDDGRLLAAGTALPGGTLLWDLAAGVEPVTLPLPDPDSAVTGLAFETTEGWLAEGGGSLAGGSLRLWDVSNPADPVVVFEDFDVRGVVLDVAFGPGGTQLVAGADDGSLLWWDLFRDTAQREGGPVPAHTGPVYAVAFSPDGATVVSAGDDGRILVWDADSRTRIAEFADFTQPVTGLAFAPRGGNLISTASGFAPGFVAWELDPDDWRRIGCAFANRNMTPDEWARYAGADEPYVEHCSTG